VLVGDVLVEERLVRGREPVTLGQSLRCTPSLPLDVLPRACTLLRPLASGGWSLVVPAGAEARVADPAAAVCALRIGDESRRPQARPRSASVRRAGRSRPGCADRPSQPLETPVLEQHTDARH
jgi:hypothetical protein